MDIKRYSYYSIVSVYFSDTLPQKDFSTNHDTICTAICRCAKKGEEITLKTSKKNTCEGGKYFVFNKPISIENIENTYIKKEQVFEKKKDLEMFLKIVGKCPKKGQYLIFSPILKKEASTLIFLCNPAQANNLLGLGAKCGIKAEIIPAISTCSGIFRPLLNPNTIHVNLIDTFTRNHQAKSFYNDSDLLISMTPESFSKISSKIKHSSYGEFVPSEVPTINVKKL